VLEAIIFFAVLSFYTDISQQFLELKPPAELVMSICWDDLPFLVSSHVATRFLDAFHYKSLHGSIFKQATGQSL
jgi:hypothetical protein